LKTSPRERANDVRNELRLHRLHENKKEVIVYDYADVLLPMLARMFKKRLAGYSALGYDVSNGPLA
jgi:hypothetical protein